MDSRLLPSALSFSFLVSSPEQSKQGQINEHSSQNKNVRFLYGNNNLGGGRVENVVPR